MKKAIFVVMLLFLGVSSVWAQEDAPQELDLRARHIYASDIDATASDITATETSFEYTRKLKTFGELPVDISLKVAHTDIKENDPLDVPNHLESRSLGLSTKFPAPFVPDDRFFVGLDAFPTLNTDNWDWEGGAFRIPFRSYLIFKESDDFILIGGVSVRPEYDQEVLPVVGMIYRPNDRLSFNLASSHPNVSYKLDDRTTALWEFDYTLEEYEVMRGTQGGVVLKYQQVTSGVGLRHQFSANCDGLLSIGAAFNRRLEYRDGVGKIAPDTGMYVSADLTANF